MRSIIDPYACFGVGPYRVYDRPLCTQVVDPYDVYHRPLCSQAVDPYDVYHRPLCIATYHVWYRPLS